MLFISALLLATLGLLGAGALYLVVRHHAKDLPDVRTLEQGYVPPQVTRVFARDGTLLVNLFSERRTVVPFERIPDHAKTAFLAAEDAGFYQHEGLDFWGVLRALIVNLRSGRVRQGGSTITMQVVKNVLLDNERSYRRKIRETILAYRLEQTLSKEEILGLYMNQLYLGHGRYGIEEASQFYFGKHVEEIDVAQSALLAGIVAAPERYSPRKNEDAALSRRRYVLGQMLEKGFMTQPVFDASIDEPIRLAPSVETHSDIAPEMLGHATRLLDEMLGDRARKGGYSVHTTIDPALQVAARKAVRDGLDDYLKRQKLAPPFTLKKRRLWGPAFEGRPRQHGIYVGKVLERDDQAHEISVQVGQIQGVVSLNNEERFNPTHLAPSEFVGPEAALRVRVVDDPETATSESPVRLRLELGPQAALVALDPRSREVLAAIGSYEALPGGLDRSYQAKRQPGSTFKPLVYSYALNAHQVTAATPFEFETTERVEGEDGEEREEKVVQRLSLRTGVAKSDNRVAQKVLSMVGPAQAVEWAHALGISSKLGATESLMLGAYEVTVTEMAAAFSVFASGGTAQDPLFVSRVESGGGELPLAARAVERRVMEPAVAYLTTSVLKSVIEEGTGRRARSLGRPLAGKTGTTNKAKDAWFVGYSTDLVVAVWVGYDDALPLGWGESGATSALPIWAALMKAAHEGKPATDFPRPAEIVEAQIDPVSGYLARYGQADAVSEVFLSGTVPQKVAQQPEPSDPEPPTPDALEAPGGAPRQTGATENGAPEPTPEPSPSTPGPLPLPGVGPPPPPF